MFDKKDTEITAGEATNKIGFLKSDYKGKLSTLCAGCGHTSVANQIITACYELNLRPENMMKFSGIGCSSKSPTYFLGNSFGFNGLHGRMPSLALGASFANTSMKIIGISGDGDTASIGLGQFMHLVRRNLPMVYIIENNGVYGLTKGQFSATAEKGLKLKKQGVNQFLPVDICLEALAANASFVARSFAGDPRQLVTLIKAAFSHRGTAVIDVISPCVTFHNTENSHHSFAWVRENKITVQDVGFISPEEEIMIDDYPEGATQDVKLFDGSVLRLKKVDIDYDPTDKVAAFQLLAKADMDDKIITGLFYINPEQTTIVDMHDLPNDLPMNRIPADRLRPSEASLQAINESMQ